MVYAREPHFRAAMFVSLVRDSIQEGIHTVAYVHMSVCVLGCAYACVLECMLGVFVSMHT